MKGNVLKSRKGETYIDTGVKILSAVVCGALILGSVFWILKDTVFKNVKTEIGNLFNVPYSDPLVWEKGTIIVPASGANWSMEGNTLTGYKGTLTENMNLVIPNEVDGVRVLKIQNLAANDSAAGTRYNIFGATSLTTPFTLTISDGIKEIGSCAFYNCTGLTGSLSFPDSVTRIGTYAFYQCSGITGELILGDSIRTVDMYAFSRMSALTGLTISPNMTAITKSAFSLCGLTKLEIPGNIKTIGYAAFANNLNMKTLILHDGIKVIEEMAFQMCTSARGNLVIPDSVTTIADKAFTLSASGGFDGTLTLSKNVTYIGTGAFQYQNFSGELVIPDSVTSMGQSVFLKNYNLTGLKLSNSLAAIPQAAFEYCYNIGGNIVIPDSVKVIGSYAFSNCYKLSGDLVIPNSVEAIETYAFNRCYLLTGNVFIPDSVTVLGKDAFDETAITSLSVPSHIPEATVRACFTVTTPPPITIRP